MATLEQLEPGTTVDGLARGPVELTNVRWMGDDLVLISYSGDDGTPLRDFLTRADEPALRVSNGPEGHQPFFHYPAGVARLFATAAELHPILRRARSAHRLHTVVQAYLAELARRLSTPLATVSEIYGVAGARNDALSAGGGHEILWEVFGTVGQVEGDLRKLERDTAPRRLKVAVVVDSEIDPKLFERFLRSVQGSSVQHWFSVTDVMVQGRFEATLRTIDKALAHLEPAWPDQLEALGFGLADTHRYWKPVEEVPFGFGLHGHGPFEPLEDPTFFVDVRNIGRVEARLAAAFANVRFRQAKFHGLTGDHRLLHPAVVVIPLANGAEGHHEVPIEPPIVVPAGAIQRVLVRLADAGFAWRGEVELGVRYGTRRTLNLPALSIFV